MPKSAVPTYRLVSFTGEQRHFDLPAGRPLVVGRGATSDLAVYDPTISRRHAELTVTPDGVMVRDLDSSNGTCINGSRVSSGRLSAGDSITFGKILFQLQAIHPVPEQRLHAPTPNLRTSGGSNIVRQVEVAAGRPPLPSLAGTSGVGQLKVAATDDHERLAKKLSLLLEISQKLSGELDLDRLLSTVVDTMFEVMNVDRVSILMRTAGTGELVSRLSRSRLGEGQFQQVPRSIVDKVVQERVAVLSDNAVDDSRFTGQSILMQSVRSAMCSPLMASSDEVLGLLYVDNLSAPNSFSDEDLQFLVAFSGLAAIAIKNSRYAEQIQRQTLVRSNFERYFAPNVAAEIAHRPTAVAPGGEKRPVTVVFSDIRNFTAMAEGMGPDAIAGLLSDYFTEMVDLIFEHGGTLDKFIGDALMALWGAPIARPDDPDRAVRAAMAMQRSVNALNQAWTAGGRPAISVGIGINYGEAFAGNIGSHRRLEYTVIGDVVNVAARLCDHAGPGEILLTEPLLDALHDPPPTTRLAQIVLKGKAQPVDVFRVQAEGR
ncbi:MAG TPA: adenylate/guanylate cyclase domain-containing protein [Gemmatimonadales bacterium]|nr:adenylate/guanylate cyclase domain-containing protein [Gemmatimonadales bacterium]